MSKYLIFEKDPEGTQVLNKDTRALVGKIIFYPSWRQHVLEARPHSVFSAGCLLEIFWKMKFMNREKRKKRKGGCPPDFIPGEED